MSEATFVLCIENNAICQQALLLCESIRMFGGRHRSAPIVAVSPRDLGVDQETRRRLDAMSVEYVEEPLNLVCPEYGSANRVFAAAWAESRAQTDWIVVLDSDTIFLDELELPRTADVGVRPIDVKGCATAGPDDPFEQYWIRLAELQGVSLDRLPFVETTASADRVRAVYNGGIIAVRRNRGILVAWADLFSRSVHEGLKPWRGRGLNVRASTGHVGCAASEYWGSNQVAAALAIWARTDNVQLLADAYNVPLHILVDRPDLLAPPRLKPVHVHYHWMFTDLYYRSALGALRQLGTGPDRLEWLAERLPIA